MKIYSPYPEIINKAIAENLAVQFVASAKDAEVALPTLPLPINLNNIITFLESHYSRITIKDMKLDVLKKTLSNPKSSLDLTEKEAAILEYLANSPTTITRDDLIKNVWNYSEGVNTNTVESHIYRLRQKLLATFGEEIILTEAGNYKLVEN